MSHKQKKHTGLGTNEKRSLHLVEFSKGKPNELSLNVLDNLASDTGEKRGFFSRLFGGRQDTAHPSTQVIGSDVGAPKVSSHSSASGDTGKISSSVVLGETDRTAKKSSKRVKTSVSDTPKEGLSSYKADKKAKNAKRAAKANLNKVNALTKKKEAITQTPLLGADSAQEIERRQRARRRYRIASIFVVIVLCIAGLSAGGYYLYGQYLEQLEGIDLLKASVGNVEGADNTIVAIDDYFSRPFDDNSVSEANHLQDDIPGAESRLDNAADMANRAVEGLDIGSDDRQAAEHAVSSIALRRELLEIANQRLTDDIAAKTAYDKMEEAWTAVQEANAMMVQAANLVADTTKDNVNQATEYMKQAKERFKDAKSSLKEGFKSYSLIKEDKEYDYIDLRIKSIDYALASNEAILIQDKKTAEKNNSKYNKLDKRAAKIISKYSDGFTSVVVSAYAANQKELQTKYESVRSDMGTHDSYLRDYLGNDSWV